LSDPNGRCGDIYIEYNIDTYNLSEVNNASFWASGGLYNWSDSYSFTLQNSFGSGTIKLRTTDYNHGSPIQRKDASFPHQISENYDGQAVDNYERKFRNWQFPTGSSNSNCYDLSVNNLGNRTSNSVQARYAAKCNISFAYKYQGKSDNSGMLYVNSNYYNSPTSSFGMYDDNTQSATANSQTLYSVIYSFASWKKVVGSDTTTESTSQTLNFTPSSHATYIAYVIPVKPESKAINYIGNTGDYIHLTWSENSNDDSRITHYQVWRRVRHNGVTGNATLLTTLDRGTTSFIDYDYLYTSSYTDDLLWYDVKPQLDLSSGTVYSDDNWQAVYGRLDPSVERGNNLAIMNIVPSDYSITSYPNPFNPTTVIRYALPEECEVSLKVYNILSQEVASLVNEAKSAGSHTVNFNANNLPSGIYIARLQAGSKVLSIKLQLVK